MALFGSLHELIFPTRCLACSALGLTLCHRCKAGWSPSLYRTYLRASGGVHVTSSVLYSDIGKKIILAAKESQIRSADQLVAAAITHSLQMVLRHEWVDFIVPIPSRPSAARLRGRQFIAEMAQISGDRCGIEVQSLLLHSRHVRDQSGLLTKERWNNLEGAFVVQGNQPVLGRALLVDDLVTTGATLSEAARALRYAGIEVIGAVTAALAQTVR
jgi:predicted amidophosphoribosyltransferase